MTESNKILLLKKELDLKNEENQLLHIENQRLIEIEQSHKKLNGKLRMEFLEEIEKVKKEADRLMMKKIT